MVSAGASASIEAVGVVLRESGKSRDTARMLELLSLKTRVSAMGVLQWIDLFGRVYHAGRTSFHSMSATMSGTLIRVVV